MFIQLKKSVGYVNLDDITRVDQRKNSVFAKMRDGDVVELGGVNQNFDFESASAQVVKAEPGFELVQDCSEGDQVCVYREPIIAWRVGPTYANPVCIDMSRSDMENTNDLGIKYPNGRVLVRFDATYDSEEDWLKAQRERRLSKASA